MSWNVRDLLGQCIASIPPDLAAQIIVVDNDSHDGSVAMLEASYPEVRVIPNTANIGFPKACNQGLALAERRYTLFLNPDMILSPSTLPRCTRYLDEHEDAGAVGCRLTDERGNARLEAGRRMHRPIDIAYELFLLRRLFPKTPAFGRLLMTDWSHDTVRDVDCITGAFLMGRTDLLRKIGGMDETHFMYLEDIDLCYRIRKSGARIVFLGDVSAVHLKGRSARQTSRSSWLWLHQAYELFFRRYFGPRSAFVFRVIVFAGSLFRIVATAMGLLALTVVRRRNDEFSVATLRRYFWLLQWSLGAAPAAWLRPKLTSDP